MFCNEVIIRPSGLEAVDLGLSVKWANMNVGATIPTGKGHYFAWGEKEPQLIEEYSKEYFEKSSQPNYDKRSYKLCRGANNTLIKYCIQESRGTVDCKTELEPVDDAATISWGGKWRMPTKIEQEELRNKCFWQWTQSYKETGIPGYIVFKAKCQSDKGLIRNMYKRDAPQYSYALSDTHIFLPASGYFSDMQMMEVWTEGQYWSKSLDEKDSNEAVYLYMIRSGADWYSGDRYEGRSIRAVCE